MADITYQIAPRVATAATWASENPTLGKVTGGKTYGGLVIATSMTTYGTVLVYGADQTYAAAVAAGQFIPLDSTPVFGSVATIASSRSIFAGATDDGSTEVQVNGKMLSTYLTLNSTEPNLVWYETDAGADQKRARLYNSSGVFIGEFVNDAFSATSKWLEVKRATGAHTVATVSFPTGHLLVAGATDDTTSDLQVNGPIKGTHILPLANDTYDVGSAELRFDDIFATNGTIQTSDARYKTEVKPFSKGEIEAAKQMSKEIGMFQWLKAVGEKGADARKHIGLTVQRAIEIMEANKLKPFDYGFICYDEWEDTIAPEYEEQVEEVDKGGKPITEEFVITEATEEVDAVVETRAKYKTVKYPERKVIEAGNRFSFRYEQLNLFIARGIEARLSLLESK